MSLLQQPNEESNRLWDVRLKAEESNRLWDVRLKAEERACGPGVYFRNLSLRLSFTKKIILWLVHIMLSNDH
jgi:hypothetical protein